MYELTHKNGTKIIAYLKSDGNWYDEQGWLLRTDCWVWCEEIKLYFLDNLYPLNLTDIFIII